MRISTVPTLLVAVTAVLATLGASPAARAEPPIPGPLPRYLAVEIDDYGRGPGEQKISESVQRRVMRHLMPRLESLGFVAERVHDARRAVRVDTHHYGVRLKINARRLWLLYSAHEYDDDFERRRVFADADHGTEIWGHWMLWSHDDDRMVTEGHIGPVMSQSTDTGMGRPILDDEETVSRVFVDLSMDVIEPWIDYLVATPPEYRPKKKHYR